MCSSSTSRSCRSRRHRKVNKTTSRAAGGQPLTAEGQQQQQPQLQLDLNSLLVNSMQSLLNQHMQALQASMQKQQQQQQQQQSATAEPHPPQVPDPAALSSAM